MSAAFDEETESTIGIGQGKKIRFGTATDIHDQEAVAEILLKTQSELIKSRDQLDVIQQGAGVGILAQDASGKYVFVNEVSAHTSGFATTGEFLCASVEEVYRRVAMRNKDNKAIDLEALPSRADQRGRNELARETSSLREHRPQHG